MGGEPYENKSIIRKEDRRHCACVGDRRHIHDSRLEQTTACQRVRLGNPFPVAGRRRQSAGSGAELYPDHQCTVRRRKPVPETFRVTDDVRCGRRRIRKFRCLRCTVQEHVLGRSVCTGIFGDEKRCFHGRDGWRLCVLCL